MSSLFIASREKIPPDESRRMVVAGAVIGPWVDLRGPDTDALTGALLEGYEQPRGYFLRRYRERRAAKTAAGGYR